MKCCRAHSQR